MIEPILASFKIKYHLGTDLLIFKGRRVDGKMFSGLDFSFFNDASMSFYSRFYKANNSTDPGLGFLGAKDGPVFFFFFLS